MRGKPKIVVICGPTGIGKTSVAIEMARVFHGEIISADSMQLYKYMDIGTAKPTLEEQARARHHLIDILTPDQNFDAARYAEMARAKIRELHAQGILPIVAGGTGFYIKALVHGLFSGKSSDPDIRARLKTEAAMQGPETLYKRLIQCDPDTAQRLHPNDTFRIARALEVYEITGKPLSEYQRDHQFADDPFDALKIGLEKEREVLYDRINQRVDMMIDHGLIDEVKHLLDMGYTEDLRSMQSIGYRHISDFICGRLSYDEAVRTLKRDTRRYAKRQLTWFRADPGMVWKEADRLSEIRGLIDNELRGKRPTNQQYSSFG